eukprot:scaffold3362_cov402-Prasinococcus_capsulatus_cf.AAC.4
MPTLAAAATNTSVSSGLLSPEGLACWAEILLCRRGAWKWLPEFSMVRPAPLCGGRTLARDSDRAMAANEQRGRCLGSRRENTLGWGIPAGARLAGYQRATAAGQDVRKYG